MSLILGGNYTFSVILRHIDGHCLKFEVLVTFLSFPGCASLWCNCFSFRPPTGRPNDVGLHV